MSLTKEDRQIIREKYERSNGDSGSPEVQVALLSSRIKNITEHLKKSKKDHASRRGLRKLVGRRTKLLRYLSNNDFGRYQAVIASLGLRR